MAEAPPSWPDIPPELAGEVLRLLPALADRARFAAVCLRWRAAARRLPGPPPPLPLLALDDGTFFSLPRKERFRFPDRAAGYVNTCGGGGWLVGARRDGFFLLDPFSDATMPLPPFLRRRHVEDFAENAKVILCSPDLVAAVMGVRLSTQLAVCHPRGSSWSVTPDQDEWDGFQDIAFHKGKLYALDGDENLLAVDIGDDGAGGGGLRPRVSRISTTIRGAPPYEGMGMSSQSWYGKLLYLVESPSPSRGGGALLMVRREVRYSGIREETVSVFEADVERSRWAKVATVGDDEALFVGRLCSGAVDVAQYGLPGDHIFFADDDDDDVELNDELCRRGEERSATRAYSMKGGSCVGVASSVPMIPWAKRHTEARATWFFPRDPRSEAAS